LTVPPETIDVNVHPAKWEIRFSDPRTIHQLVRSCVRQAMSERQWLGAGAHGASESMVGPTARTAGADSAGAGAPPDPPRNASDWVFARTQADLPGHDRVAENPSPTTAGMDASASEPERVLFGRLRIVGQLLASYLVVEGKSSLILVDQHAAHERILYERLRAQWLDDGVASQALLAPETVGIEALALAALVDASERAARLGFDVEPFGEDAVVVRAIPALLAGRNPAELIRGLARELQGPDLSNDGRASDTRLVQPADRVFATLACHSARRFGDHLELGEQQAILRGLDEIPWAPTCPHGRPVAISLGVSEIERRFGRR
jgi:DNA mismatch repair protein MutL